MSFPYVLLLAILAPLTQARHNTLLLDEIQLAKILIDITSQIAGFVLNAFVTMVANGLLTFEVILRTLVTNIWDIPKLLLFPIQFLMDLGDKILESTALSKILDACSKGKITCQTLKMQVGGNEVTCYNYAQSTSVVNVTGFGVSPALCKGVTDLVNCNARKCANLYPAGIDVTISIGLTQSSVVQFESDEGTSLVVCSTQGFCVVSESQGDSGVFDVQSVTWP